jgi:Tol biopolymer transport system component
MSWTGSAFGPSFSPDGNKVAFTWNSEKEDTYHVYLEQVGSGVRPVQLTSGPANDCCPAWSPDDRYIAFMRAVGSGRALMLVPSVGGPERKIADFPGQIGALSWTPDSKWLATALRDSPQDPFGIWLISVSTGERRRLTTGAAGRLGDRWPSISPDGRSLAFTREMTSYAYAPYVLTLSQDYRPEGEPRELTTQRYGSVGGTAWTGDGREIVFSAGEFLTQSLFRVPASGRHLPSRLLYVSPDAARPIISHTRSRLAYVRGTSNWNLWRLDVRTSERKMLVSSNGYAFLAQYSPDGRRLAFQSTRSGEFGVWTCDADGSNCMQLTSLGNAAGGTPRWSPDSQSIAFDWRVEGRSQIYVIQADGGVQRRMTNNPADDITPSWSHDGRWIYFASDRSGRMETWKIPAAGGAAVEVEHVGMGPVFESVDGQYLYYIKRSGWGDGPGPIMRMPVTGGAEVQIIPQVANWMAFAVAAKAIYFTPDGKAIQRLELSSGKIGTLATVEKGVGSLCVSPDEAFVVWPQTDHRTDELMLVEGFR